MRKRYEELMAHPEQIEAILQAGAAKARVYAQELIAKLRWAVGLRSFEAPKAAAQTAVKVKKVQAVFKQYREKDGKFYFKLTFEGRELFLSDAFESGRDAGQWVGRLKKDAVALADAPVHLCEGVTADDVKAALATFAED